MKEAISFNYKEDQNKWETLKTKIFKFYSTFQLRLDLNTFVITGPSTITLSAGLEVGGSLSTAGGVPFALATQCQTDTFSMTGVPGGTPPVICGTNSGYHSKHNYGILINEWNK